MAGPASAPTSELFQLQAQIADLQKRLGFAEDNIGILMDLVAAHKKRIAFLEAIPRPEPTSAKKHEKKIKKVEAILQARNNEPISFVDLGGRLGYPIDTRRQNMTHLAKVFKANPDKYEVRDSKFGGKTVKLNSAYHNHLTGGGV